MLYTLELLGKALGFIQQFIGWALIAAAWGGAMQLAVSLAVLAALLLLQQPTDATGDSVSVDAGKKYTFDAAVCVSQGTLRRHVDKRNPYQTFQGWQEFYLHWGHRVRGDHAANLKVKGVPLCDFQTPHHLPYLKVFEDGELLEVIDVRHKPALEIKLMFEEFGLRFDDRTDDL